MGAAAVRDHSLRPAPEPEHPPSAPEPVAPSEPEAPVVPPETDDGPKRGTEDQPKP